MATNMAELAKNMEELDKESALLYSQLGTLEADLRKETSNFDEAVRSVCVVYVRMCVCAREDGEGVDTIFFISIVIVIFLIPQFSYFPTSLNLRLFAFSRVHTTTQHTITNHNTHHTP
jgi:hypothetical protein